MTRAAIAVLLALAAMPPAARAQTVLEPEPVECLAAASAAYHVPLRVLLVLLRVEGGTLGHVSENSNETVDIGPMQINSAWVPKVAAHWRTTPDVAFRTLRDRFCPNVEAGSWILRQGLDEARGNLWDGVAYYHSHDPDLGRDYLRKVFDVLTGMQARARLTPSTATGTHGNLMVAETSPGERSRSITR